MPETVVVKFNTSDYIKAYINNRERPLGMRRRSKEGEKKARVSKTKKELLIELFIEIKSNIEVKIPEDYKRKI